MAQFQTPNDLGRVESASMANPLEEIEAQEQMAMLDPTAMTDPGMSNPGIAPGIPSPNMMGGMPPQGLEQEPQNPLDAIDDDVKAALLVLIDMFEDEDRYVRQKQIRKWKRNECYWNNLQHVFWSDIIGDWVQPTDQEFTNAGLEGIRPEDFEKIVNVYKAHGESIIAALSVQPPGTSFYPDDADSPLDISTAKGYSKIAELIQKHNKSSLLFVKALHYRWTDGIVFCYNYYDKDKKYGSTQKPQFSMRPEEISGSECPQCGAPMYPEDSMCPECGYQGPPEMSTQRFMVPQLVGMTDEPKGRECMEIYGGVYCKISQQARKQEDTPYLIMAFEQHYAMMKNMYPWIADTIRPEYPDKDYYDRFGRVGTQFFGDYPDNLAAVRCCWFRPWAFLAHSNRELGQRMQQMWPNGLYVVKVGEELADIREEALDEHWTVSIDPFSRNLHAEPMGQALLPIQDMTNELFRLTIETVEYGIPESFVDGEVLDLDKFEQQELRPGNLTAAKAPPGGNLSAGFHTLHSATLSREVEPFAARLEAAGQFVPGSFPSIYGGPAKGSKTASEYEQSRAQNLQRLSTYWKSMAYFWSDSTSRAVTEFVNNMEDDERDVQKQGTGFVNVFIKKAELTGKVGKVEPEISEDLPLSAGQKRALLLRLFELQLPEVNSVMFAPINANLMKLAMGMPEFNVPGEEDRNKQYDEIQELLQGQPMDEMGQMSSVPVDPDVDRHEIEAEVLQDWLVSEEGQFNKKVNPAGYMNCVAHFREHKAIAAQRAMQAAMQEAAMNQTTSSGRESQAGDRGEQNG